MSRPAFSGWRRWAGAVSAGIEDWSGDPEIGFHSRCRETERVAAGVEAAESLDFEFTFAGSAPDRRSHTPAEHGRTLHEAIAADLTNRYTEFLSEE